MHVSIHALLCGVRLDTDVYTHPLGHISIRALLYGVRWASMSSALFPRRFRFTHPTQGCDYFEMRDKNDCTSFDSRTHIGCDKHFNILISIHSISIHAPHTGCDPDGSPLLFRKIISIHAPYTGCDVSPSLQRL